MNSEKPHDNFNNGRQTVRSLVIKKFNVSDNGLYICDLYRKSVKWGTHEEKYVGIKGMYLVSDIYSLTPWMKFYEYQ
jgi:hypothetical protein